MRTSKFTTLMVRLVPPRREFIVRSGGQVRYLGVGRFGQIGFLLGAALVVGWVGFASVRYLASELVVAERNVRIASSARVIRNMQGEIDDLKRALVQQSAANKQIIERNSALHDQIAKLEIKRDQLAEARDARGREIVRLNEALSETADGRAGISRQLSDAKQRLAANQADREKLSAQIAAASEEIARLNGRIQNYNQEQASLVDELRITRSALQASANERTRAAFERSRLNERVAVLSERLEFFETSQAESIDRLGEGADQGISALERTLVVAGLDIPLMLKRVLGDDADLAEGVGGPLVALAEGPGSDAGEKLAAVEQRLLRLQGLQGLMKHLPLAAPMDEFRLTSGFGKRHDPFTSQLAMHPGLDFASRKRNPVNVTAAGTVTFVGWKGGYGKVVEVDHGLGIRTRYAHLSRIFVKRGQVVEFREKVGLVGSTGRSTSTHLYYEIMVDGQQLDPANFLRAGQYVFKN